MIELKQYNGNVIDLSQSAKFAYHYHKPGAYAKYILENEINNGMWADEILGTIADDAVIIDAGMNVGLFSLYLEAKNRTFYGVEPCAQHILVANDLLAKFGHAFCIYEGVLFNKDGMVTLCEAPENTTSNRVGEGGGLKVESRRLKTFLEERNIEEVGLLKLDVEGSEKQIILEDPSIGEALAKCKIVFIETHVAPGYMTIEERDAMLEKIQGFGFTVLEARRAGSYYFINSK